MNTHHKRHNPFYFVLVIVGIAFVITACGFVVLMVRELEPRRGRPDNQAGLIRLLDKHGVLIMTSELAILAFTTVAAISTDGYWNPPPDKQKDPNR